MNKTIKPGKQRKRLYHLPKHKRKKRMTAKLSKNLSGQTGKKRISIRKGDTIRIMRGKYKKKEGKISKCFPKTGKVFIGEINKKKISGTEKPVQFEVSNLMVIALNTKDKKRFKENKPKKGGE